MARDLFTNVIDRYLDKLPQLDPRERKRRGGILKFPDVNVAKAFEEIEKAGLVLNIEISKAMVPFIEKLQETTDTATDAIAELPPGEANKALTLLQEGFDIPMNAYLELWKQTFKFSREIQTNSLSKLRAKQKKRGK